MIKDVSIHVSKLGNLFLVDSIDYLDQLIVEVGETVLFEWYHKEYRAVVTDIAHDRNGVAWQLTLIEF